MTVDLISLGVKQDVYRIVMPFQDSVPLFPVEVESVVAIQAPVDLSPVENSPMSSDTNAVLNFND